MKLRLPFFTLLMVSLLAGQALAQGNATTAEPFSEEGLAVWYGQEFQGKPTASGELFDMNELTAAHKYLPFDTMVRVTNLENGATVDVRINDRGPFTPGQVIDLSFAAARELGITEPTPMPVRIEVLGSVPAPETQGEISGSFYIQVAAFEDEDKARQFYEILLGQGHPHARITQVMSEGRWVYRVQIGAFQTLSQAQQALLEIIGQHPGSFITSDTLR